MFCTCSILCFLFPGPHGTPALTQIPVHVCPLEALVEDHEPELKQTSRDSVQPALPFVACRLGTFHYSFEDHRSLNEAVTLEKNRRYPEVFSTEVLSFGNTRKRGNWVMSASSTEIMGMSHGKTSVTRKQIILKIKLLQDRLQRHELS